MCNKILIVDDEVSICDLLKTELELEGYLCACAGDGIKALELFESFSPDLVLLDIMLPELNGYEVCSRLSGGVPVIMLSAKAEVSDKIEGLDIGADDYITKPFDKKSFLPESRLIYDATSCLSPKTPNRKYTKTGSFPQFPHLKACT